MSNDGLPPYDPLWDPNFRAHRSLYLDDWATVVQPYDDKAQKMVGHSVTYGSTALQASYLLNGGALAALPALLTSLTSAGAAAIANAAIPFVVGITATGAASFASYVNYQMIAAMYWHDSEVMGAQLRRSYQKTADPLPDPKKRVTLGRWAKATYLISVIAAAIALGAFVCGCIAYIDLAREHESPKQNHARISDLSHAPPRH